MVEKMAIVLLFASACGLTACGGDNGTQDTASTQLAPSNTSESPAPAPESSNKESAQELVASLIDGSVLTNAHMSGSPCSLDTINGSYSKTSVVVARSQPAAFVGWVLNTTKRPAGKFRLVLKGVNDYVISSSTGVVRKDVSDYFKDPSLSSAGFDILGNLSSVATGDYKVILLIGDDGKNYFCETGKSITAQ